MDNMSRRRFMERTAQGAAGVLGASIVGCATTPPETATTRRPNILFAMADDWSWPHASAYGAGGVRTPAFDRVAREGCLFGQAFTAAPQCAPNRAATLTGRNIWQLEEAGTHAAIFPNKFPVFTDSLTDAGYHVGYTGKGWAPGSWERGGWKQNPAGKEYNNHWFEEAPREWLAREQYDRNFEDFLEARPENTPFFFWFGCREPHRKYVVGSGEAAGKRIEDVTVPPFLPDDPVVRSDMLDYFLEVEYFDQHLAAMLAQLEAIGELDNTIVLVTSDNGMPFPRAKANLHEYGTHVPMAVRWPEHIESGQQVDALVSFIDLGPTFLEAAAATVPPGVTGRSFLGTITGEGSDEREYVLTGRERHSHSRYDNWGYPSRAIRTDEYLYIRNFKPDRWPAGDPPGYHDIDYGPTMDFMLENRDRYPELFALGFGKHPAEELYDIRQDSGCLRNLAQNPAHTETKQKLAAQLEQLLTEQGDPRVLGTGDIFDSYPRVSHTRPWLGGFAERGEYNPRYQP